MIYFTLSFCLRIIKGKSNLCERLGIREIREFSDCPKYYHLKDQPNDFCLQNSVIPTIYKERVVPFIQSWRPQHFHTFTNFFNRKRKKGKVMKSLESSHSYICLTHTKMTTCVCIIFENPLYLDKKLFLLKKSQLTSLFIQHNQSPDTSIFTLHPNNGSKVEKELERKQRKKNQ